MKYFLCCHKVKKITIKMYSGLSVELCCRHFSVDSPTFALITAWTPLVCAKPDDSCYATKIWQCSQSFLWCHRAPNLGLRSDNWGKSITVETPWSSLVYKYESFSTKMQTREGSMALKNGASLLGQGGVISVLVSNSIGYNQADPRLLGLHVLADPLETFGP